MIENFVLVSTLIMTGSLGKKLKLLPQGSAHILNSFVLNISLPAMILISIPKLVISEAVLFPISFHWVLYFINILLVLFFSKIFKFKRSVIGVLLVVSCLGNTAFLGIPVTSSFYGESAIPFAVLYDQLGSGFAFIFTAAFILPKFTGKTSESIKEVFVDLFKFPPFLALMGGFVLMYWPLPELINNTFTHISKTLIPCAMIAVGFEMKYKLSLSKTKPILVGLGIKLIILPLFAVFFGSFVGGQYLAVDVSIIQAGMPPMITAGAMAMQEDLENDIAAGLVGYGLFISFLTLSLFK